LNSVSGFLAAIAALCQAAPGPPAGGETASLLVLAVLQGLTEFLPVSSSGHLVLGSELLGLRSVDGVLVTVALHAGTLVAVLAVYGRDLLAILRRALRGQAGELWLLLVASLPAALVGIGLGEQLEPLFESPDAAAAGLLATAAILLAGERARRRAIPEVEGPSAEGPAQAPLTLGQATVVGLAQALAILPGISRSGATISAGLLCGVDPARAARFSFLLSLPAVGGATLLELGALEDLPDESLRGIGLALVISALVGLAALRLLLVALRRGSFPWFAGYCALVASAWFVAG
jgi:undecaprenyl-diphosphatase